MSDEVDVIVVGLGPGGEEVAGRLLAAGRTVLGIESGSMGGECANWGCVPSKMMLRAAHVLAEAGRVDSLAGRADVQAQWRRVADRIRAEVLPGGDDHSSVAGFEARGGRFVRGTGRLLGDGRVAVGGRTFRARRAVVLATGTRAAVPPVPGLAGTPFWTNREATHARDLPASLAVLGGGAVGVELAQAFARFGTEVTVYEAGPRLLAREEPEASDVVAEALGRDGVRVRCGVTIDRVGHDGSHFQVEVAGAAATYQRLVVAAGREYRLRDLGLEAVGLDPAGPIAVDGRMRAADGVWAVGDVTGRGAYTHVATYQAGVAACDILGELVAPAAYHAVPRVTFTDPEVGAVGLTEAAAREAGLAVQVCRASVPESARGWLHHAGNSGFVTLVIDADREVLVGATSAGPAGGEVLGLLTLAVHARVPASQLQHMVYAYPTFHRAVQDALRDWRPAP
ncbi:pyridine nucleotide-disulfide oxidoreductase [Pilimelia terevasa]|uniref:Pyridine nucleotide-disulfide oxidoreductase n=1 Tax=Pilimelia terevasa TaxID=53372 RepID=A0A8J3BQ68_9ACTN|nr:NAD(P)/FAD-dependent oxidoreductase [Pilimelia terevasa]GGK40133.1 pyridine nucleotide-disulfide oxidoreductase [Pilimelia terevasa]